MTVGELLEQIRFSHAYTMRLLDATPEADWFRIPSGGVSHIAWQVGHLAMAVYRLALERIRGRQPGDETLLDDAFLSTFGRETVPAVDSGLYPSVAALRAAYERVHARAQEELASLSDADLTLPPHKPHVLCATRAACLRWCSHHEMIHAGQIGLLRRQLGHAPLW